MRGVVAVAWERALRVEESVTVNNPSTLCSFVLDNNDISRNFCVIQGVKVRRFYPKAAGRVYTHLLQVLQLIKRSNKRSQLVKRMPPRERERGEGYIREKDRRQGGR